MHLYRKIILAAVCFATLLTACKKEEDTTKEYLTGTLSISMPGYLKPGDSKTFNVADLAVLSRTDGGNVGYYVSYPGQKVNDTLWTESGKHIKDQFVITAPDTLGYMSFTFCGFGDEELYYSKSVSGNFTVVKAGVNGTSSMTGYAIDDKTPKFTDPRDGREYLATDVNGTLWMRQNLCWEGAGKPYMDSPATSDVFGRYYTWEEARTACPDGWRLPLESDWAKLCEAMGVSFTPKADIPGLAGKLMENISFNDKRMWEFNREVKVTNQSGLSAVPTGYALVDADGYTFCDFYNYAAFWTGDEFDAGTALLRYMYYNSEIVFAGKISKTDFATTVRCVKD